MGGETLSTRPSSAGTIEAARPKAERAFTQSSLRQALVVLVCFKVVGIIVFLDPNGIQSFDLPKSLFSRAIAFVLAGLIVLVVLRYGHWVIPRTNLHLAVGLFLLANVLSAVFAESQFLAIYGESDRYLGLTFLVDMAVLYLAVAVAFRRAEDFGVFFAAIGVATLLVCGYAAAQYVGIDPVGWLRYEGDRPFSTLGLADQLGHLLSVCFGFALGVLAFAAGRYRGLIRWVAAAFAILVVATTAVVATRGSLLGIAAAFVAVLLIRFKLDRAERSRRLRGVVALTALGVALLIVLAVSPLGARAAKSVEDEGSGRLGVYRVVFLAALDRPVLGYGPDNLATAYNKYRESPSDGRGSGQTSAHNWALQTLVTTGAVGLASQLLLLGAFGGTLWSRALVRLPAVAGCLGAALAAYWANALVSVGSLGVDWLPWFAFGGVASIVGHRLPATTPRSTQPALAYVILAAAVIAAASPFSAFLANRNAQTARTELAGHPAAAFDAASAAVSRDSGRADYWNWLGLALERLGRPTEAATAYAEAARRAPYEATYWENLALVTAQQAAATTDRDRAVLALDAAGRAAEIDPKGWHAQQVLADVAYQLGEFELALKAAVTSITLEGKTSTYDKIAVQAAPRVSGSGTLALLETALSVKETPALQVAAADVAIRSGDISSALTHARRALVLEPRNPEAQRILAMAQR